MIRFVSYQVFAIVLAAPWLSPRAQAANNDAPQDEPPPVPAIDPHAPPEGRFADHWAEIYMAGQKVGYAHSTMTRKKDRIHTGLDMTMRLGRVDAPVELTMSERTVETVEGDPRRFESSMLMAATKMAVKGEIKDGKVTLTKSQFGMEMSTTYDFPTGALMTWGGFRESLIRGFEPGTEYVLDMYNAQFRPDGAIKARTRIGDWEQFTHGGRELRGQKVTTVLATPMGDMEMVSWVDAGGSPIKSVMPMQGMELQIITCDEKTALSKFLPPEIFMATAIKANRRIDRANAQRITYRIRASKSGIDLGDLPETSSQKVGNPREDGSIDVTVSRLSHEPSTGKVSRRPVEDVSAYLDGNLMINTADAKLIELAKKAGADETEPYALGDKLRRFVTDYVTAKNLNIGFATASEVCRTREGDCSEHAVLLAALGRLNGLPSRVAVGLAYVPVFGDKSDIFGYHMWTQFLIDGRWVDFDAALRESDCSPIRITFATSSLKNTGMADLSLPLLSKIGAIDLEILDVEPQASRNATE